jgi:hypothetical protein
MIKAILSFIFGAGLIFLACDILPMPKGRGFLEIELATEFSGSA